MALTLTANIDNHQRFFEVTGTVPDRVEPGYRFRIGDELLVLQGFVMPQHEFRVNRNQWYVRRGQDLSRAVTHTAGDEILGAADAFVASETGTTPPNPFAAGGGGGGLPTGWTQDENDPANVSTAGGTLGVVADTTDFYLFGVQTSADGGVMGLAVLGDGAEGIDTVELTAEDIAGDNFSDLLLTKAGTASLTGTVAVLVHAPVNTAPPDEVFNQQGVIGIWLDNTNGATKVKFKARQANDTFVFGEVALTAP